MELDHIGIPKAPKKGKLVLPRYKVASFRHRVRARVGRKRTRFNIEVLRAIRLLENLFGPQSTSLRGVRNPIRVNG
jgi:hypothetical protein